MKPMRAWAVKDSNGKIALQGCYQNQLGIYTDKDMATKRAAKYFLFSGIQEVEIRPITPNRKKTSKRRG